MHQRRSLIPLRVPIARTNARVELGDILDILTLDPARYLILVDLILTLRMRTWQSLGISRFINRLCITMIVVYQRHLLEIVHAMGTS